MAFKNKIIGVVGGMGPEAGVELCKNINVLTNAKKDQDHLEFILMSFPREIVDRTEFLEHRAFENPGYKIAEVIIRLEHCGANIIGIACNTSHTSAIYNVVLQQLNMAKSKVQLVHLPLETCLYIKNNFKQVKRIGLMVTTGTYKSGLYQKLLVDNGYEPIVPPFDFQNNVIHRMVYDERIGIKSNSDCENKETQRLFKKGLDFFESRNTEILVLGCTELSLLFAKISASRNMVIVDSLKCLAKALITKALNKELSEVEFIR